MKVLFDTMLFDMMIRQTTGFVEHLLHHIGLDDAVPDFTTWAAGSSPSP